MPDLLPLGLHSGIPFRDYARDPGLSASVIKVLCQQSPLHAWTAHPGLNPNYEPEHDAKMDIGTICHALLLEGENVAHVIQATKHEGQGKARRDTGVPVEDYRTDAAKEERDAVRAAGKVPILAHEMAAVHGMLESCRRQLDSHLEASDAFRFGKPEQVIIWQEPGVRCKARLDWLHDNLRVVDDFKTTSGSADPFSLSRNAAESAIQASWYRRAVRSLHPDIDDVLFRFVTQETYAPFAVSVVSPGPDVLTLGDRKCDWAVSVWRCCVVENKWPGYPPRVAYSENSPWDEERWLQREAM